MDILYVKFNINIDFSIFILYYGFAAALDCYEGLCM